jgi:hypothetical protein
LEREAAQTLKLRVHTRPRKPAVLHTEQSQSLFSTT